jgi:hypothetical protein
MPYNITHFKHFVNYLTTHVSILEAIFTIKY